jgi:L-rhamnose-H+ transport protein
LTIPTDGNNIGLIIIAIGSFGQSSSYVPINKVHSWSWESFWLVQGIFAWLVFPLLGRCWLYLQDMSFSRSMPLIRPPLVDHVLRHTLGRRRTHLRPLHALSGRGVRAEYRFRHLCRSGHHPHPRLYGQAGRPYHPRHRGCCGDARRHRHHRHRRQHEVRKLSEEEKKKAVKDFNFTWYRRCPVGRLHERLLRHRLGQRREPLFLWDGSHVQDAPATFMVTLGGFFTNALYCLYQNGKNHTWA